MAPDHADFAQMVVLWFQIGKRLLGIGLLAAVLFSQALAQKTVPSDSLRIDRILVVGNKKTKRYIILRELEFHAGDTISRRDLKLAKERIFNLNLFNYVDFRILPFSSETVLKITVVERWSLFPLPILQFHEHSFSKVAYGGGVAEYNFLGRAQQIFVLGWTGFNPGARMVYENPWFGGPKRWFTLLNIGSTVEKNHTKMFADLKARVIRATFTIGKRFDPYRGLSVVIKTERLKFSNPSAAISPSGRDRIGTVGMSFQSDTRDLHVYPSQGNLFRVEALQNWIVGGGTFSQSRLEMRHYQLVGQAIVAGRFEGQLLRGNVPLYKHIFLGYARRVRGHFNQTEEGKARALVSAALRFPLLARRYLNLSHNLPALQKLEFGLYATAFVDVAAIWPGNLQWGDEKTLRGAGVGLNFLLPYSSVLRAEYAWNEAFSGEFILDMNVAF